MIKADVVIAEQRQIIDVPVKNESEAIRVLWDTYGLSIDIKGWLSSEELEEVQDEQIEQIDSNKPDDTDESAGTSGDSQGDILQANE